MKSFKQINFLLFLGVLFGRNIAVDIENNECSINAYKCHPEAECVGVGVDGFECICKPGLEGDGFVDGTGCGPKRCENNNDCHVEAVCTAEHKCECKPGFTGTPTINCTDINECQENPGLCGEHATCENTYGSFECKCDTANNYFKNENNTCEHRCTVDSDCNTTVQRCDFTREHPICICKQGYQGDNEKCENIDECQENTHTCDINAICIDFDGGYDCTCKNGYSGDGTTCEKLKKNCDEIFQENRWAASGEYLIDPDETGPLDSMIVDCEMGDGIGVTIMKLTKYSYYFESDRINEITASYVNKMEEMESVIDAAEYCVQSTSFKCIDGAELMNGNQYWIDGKNTRQFNWGGSAVNNTCLCGSFGVCENPSSMCNCNGNAKTMYDTGDIINKDLLPVIALKLTPSQGKGVITLGDVKCAPRTFDIPRDCHEARYTYKIKNNRVQQIDVDRSGPIPAFYAYCNMEQYKHVGVTEMIHDRIGGISPTEPGSFQFTYTASNEQIKGLVDNSNFCSQDVEYICKNSRLLHHDGENKGYLSDLFGNIDQSWPGANGVTGKCGCGIFKKCENPSFGCNCDIRDGKTRKDFGIETDKSKLPIGSVTLMEIDGSEQTGTIIVSKLSCSQRVFGIPKTCQDLVEKGVIENATRLIDPDGPAVIDKYRVEEQGNTKPFPVYCSVEGPPAEYGVTEIYHEDAWQEIDITGSWSFQYMFTSLQQLLALTTRSTSCTQTVKFTCTNWPIHYEGDTLLKWKSVNGETIPNLDGYNTEISACSCGLDDPSTCASTDTNCNCDAADDTERVDNWTFSVKDYLPVTELIAEQLNASSVGKVEVGPLKCTELLPNCAALNWHKSKHRKDDESWFRGGYVVINPEAENGVKPFKVLCRRTETRITVTVSGDPTVGEPDEPVEKCYSVNYTSVDGEALTGDQVQALVKSSKYCGQTLTQRSVNAPITNMSVFSTCDDIQQTGWAGGITQCPCGETGTCLPGPDFSCNSDKEDGNIYTDGGWIDQKDRLGVCNICVKLNPTASLTTPVKKRSITLFVSDLYCDKNPKGSGKNCEEWRENGEREPSNQQVRIAGVGRNVYCNVSPYPPFAYTEITPKTPTITVNVTITTTVEYYILFLIYELIMQSSYCEQHVFIQCPNSSLNMTGYGWPSGTTDMQIKWTVNSQGTTGCAGEETCLCNLGQNVQDASIIFGSKQFPITDVSLESTDGTSTISISTVKCFDFRRTCHEILLNDEDTNPNGDGSYTIDPDQAGGVSPFVVHCDFKTKKNFGLTKVKVIMESDRSVINVTEPGGRTVNITYVHATPEQIRALANESEICIQRINYVCKNSPIYGEEEPPKSFYYTYNDELSPSWGSAEFADSRGCACAHLRSCAKGKLCNCDATGKIYVDNGFETENVPITKAQFGGQSNLSTAMFDISDVQCGPVTPRLPKDCEEAFIEFGEWRSSVQLIQPTEDVDPFLVQCDMQNLTSGGVTIINSHLGNRTDLIHGESQLIEYLGATKEQILALIGISVFCVQPVKIHCKHTKLITGEEFWWTGHNNSVENTYLGYGRHVEQECNCGRDGKCGGSELRADLIKLFRGCNCDANDDEWRADAGVFQNKDHLPINELRFTSSQLGAINPAVSIEIGPLMCGQEKFDVNECTSGKHDCHEHAICTNIEDTYTCKCKKGYEGRGRPELLVNGRNCYDDDECALGKCPRNSDCFNTEGSYECTCKPGFRPHDDPKKKCVDINECQEGIHGCDPNADCFNKPGTHVCRCKRKYQGNGTSCTPTGVCAVFGDPHMLTFDSNMFSYQGKCEYILARDRCDNMTAEPTFKVTAKFYQKFHTAKVATWVKSLTLTMGADTVEFQQEEPILRINDLKGEISTNNFQVFRLGSTIRVEGVHTKIKVVWDYDSNIAELFVPGDFSAKTCGLCGDYNGNPDDDFIVGPACVEEGTLTTNTDLLGESWINPSNTDCTADCSINTTDPCTAEDKHHAELECDNLYGRHSVFKECLAKMENVSAQGRSMREAFHYACVTDVCRVDGDIEDGLCPNAKMLLHTCISEFNVEITNFRTDKFCNVECGETKNYHLCESNPQVTCSDYLQNTTPVSGGKQCYEGCFCKEGFVIEETNCVPEEECGCIKDNVYYKKGESATATGCGESQVCLGNNIFSNPEIITCHVDATCTIKNGIFGCHCNDGYYGDGESCIEDPCDPSPCHVNETCIRNLEIETGNNYECVCGEGFYGDCGNCEDIDECSTEVRFDCPSHSKCINEIGSFRCECNEGFKLSGGVCTDLDECKLAKISGETICGENSACQNRIGHYECPCCFGYEKQNGTCVESSSAQALSGEKCCICNKPRCKENLSVKVCGTDGETYENYRDLEIEKCERDDPRLELDYYGRCRDSCQDRCPEYQKCAEDKHKVLRCLCEKCTEVEETSGKVCTKKYEVYQNLCEFKKQQCKKDVVVKTEIFDNFQECDHKKGEMPVGQWSEWSPCSVTCGKGTTTRTRNVDDVTSEFEDLYPGSETADCYQDPCPGPCVGNLTICKAKSAECIVNDFGEAVCECPTCENIEVDKVCGYIINPDVEALPKTWDSACKLQKAACKKGKDHNVYTYGSCDVDPLECSRVPMLKTIEDDNGYTSRFNVDVAECRGVCGESTTYCCEPIATELVTVTMKKEGKQSYQKNVTTITGCHCNMILT